MLSGKDDTEPIWAGSFPEGNECGKENVLRVMLLNSEATVEGDRLSSEKLILTSLIFFNKDLIPL